ncbi:MAG: FG-GAP repeat domain-containing protein, partial [Flavobacterium sp.]
YEDASAVIADFNGDKNNDLYVASGNGENAQNLEDRLYLGNQLQKAVLPLIRQNASVVRAFDYDYDGDLDLFVGNNSQYNRFGSTPDCYLLNNNKGKFTIVQSKTFEGIGMVTDAVFTDFNSDGQTDLIVVGEWMQPTFFANKKGKFTNVTTAVSSSNNNGLWQTILPFDIDHDGDFDYLLGNWGMNSKFNASDTYPLKMYYDDFDNNGAFETIVAKEKNGKYYTTMGLDELTEQFSGMLKKKFNSYQSFAGKTVEEIFDPAMLAIAKQYEVHTLQSGYLKNNKGKFVFVPFSNAMQVAPITSFVAGNFVGDAKPEVFAAGNYFGVSPYHSRFDGFSGALIIDQKTMLLGHQLGIDLTQKAVRHLDILSVNNQNYLLVTINNKPAEVYQMTNKK